MWFDFFQAMIYETAEAILFHFKIRKPVSASEKAILREINQKGYFVIRNYYPKERTEALIQEVDQLIEKNPDKVWTDITKSDHRYFNAEKDSPLILNYLEDDFINRIHSQFFLKKKCPRYT